VSTPDPLTLLETLTEELTGAGWTRQPDPAPAPGIGHVTHRLLVSPDGAAHLHATAYRVSRDLYTTLYGRDPRGEKYPPAWSASTGAVPASVLIQAVRAAAEPPGASAEARLLQAGWELAGCEYEGERLLEQRWASPDQATRTAAFFPADEPHDPGGWLIARPDQRYPKAHLDASTHTPGAVIAALALTD
jgi:hypothetical protein